MYSPKILAAASLVAVGNASFALADPDTTDSSELLPEVRVTADFRSAKLVDLPGSISVIDATTIQERSAHHLEEILNSAPNVNYSSGASRARFYQIRGIGERSQFVEPINPSVGVVIDNIDFTGLGTGSTLFDVDQVEVLRGPQGTRFGTNAMAGMINLKSADPTSDYHGKLETSVSSYDGWSLGAVTSGPLAENLNYRLAVQKTVSDGYIENDFLNRDDTNDIDESTARGKLDWAVTEHWQIAVTGIYVDVDNGYDAFSLDNNRHTLSDEPGSDRQKTRALGIDSLWDGNEQFSTRVLLSGSDSDLEYSYDEDWAYSDICLGLACEGSEYSSFDQYLRDRRDHSAEIRLVSKETGRLFNDSTDWVFGVYAHSQDEDLHRNYTYLDVPFLSRYDTERWSLYGQFESALTDRLTLISGLRYERYQADYQDSVGVAFDLDEDLWGGRLSLEYLLSESTMIYGLLSRGFKAGGVNSNPYLPDTRRDFSTETLINYEVGSKSSFLDQKLETQVSIFYQQRDDMQVRQSLVLPIDGDDCPCRFIDYSGNAAEGNNYGLEFSARWQVSQVLTLSGNLGLLDTEYRNFVNSNGEDLSGRDQAHAPNWQFTVAASYQLLPDLSLRVESEGKDGFYFSSRHDEKSDAFALWNARLDYSVKDWEVSVWGKNLFDKDYQTRGFGAFGNDPRKSYAVEPYYQFGDPRVVGVSAAYRF